LTSKAVLLDLNMSTYEMFWLMKWFNHMYSEDTEHNHAIIMETNQDPGWSISISIEDTWLEEESFEQINEYRNPSDWFQYSINKAHFVSQCSPRNLIKILSKFRNLVESRYYELLFYENTSTDDNLSWLLDWYYQCCCMNKLSCKRRVMISTIGNPGWDLHVNLQGTGFETTTFEYVKVERSEHDWYHCFIREGIFQGPCGPFNLFEVLTKFKEFVESRAPLPPLLNQ
jgi:hypothetical protein